MHVSCLSVLGSGCTLAFQLLRNDRWLGCGGPKCGGAPCPGVFFEGSDWKKCWGEVFKIYRRAGPGQIRTGDDVGLYYPRQNVWFSMWRGYGRKLPCPGLPTLQYGFQLGSRWGDCLGEKLKIYAKGKGIGATITDQDTIAIYYPHQKTFVRATVNQGVTTSKCLLQKSGGRLPPSNAAFDKCNFDALEVTIHD